MDELEEDLKGDGVMSLNVNGSTQQAGTGWFQNMKV